MGGIFFPKFFFYLLGRSILDNPSKIIQNGSNISPTISVIMNLARIRSRK